MTEQETLIRSLDANDELAVYAAAFHLPANTVYLDGNSLGPMPIKVRETLEDTLSKQWGDDLVTSWNKHQWINLPFIVGNKIAKLLGSGAGQVVCCDSVSVNLFKVLSCALSLKPDRNTILSLNSNFPTDLYIAEGLQNILGNQKCQLKKCDLENLTDQLSNDVAVLLLTQVDFRSGEMLDIEHITSLAQRFGIIVVWDLSHSAGAVPLELDQWNVDFAVGCGYKYLNGGPGAPAFIYAANRHHKSISQPLQGWMGHSAPFEFHSSYQPSKGIGSFLCGTPPIVSMAVLNCAMDIFDNVSVSSLRNKSLSLSNLFQQLVSQHPSLEELTLISPSQDNKRGGQLSYSHSHAYEICQALISSKVIADFRSPNILRFGFSPLFLSFADMTRSVAILDEIVDQRRYLQPQYAKRLQVT